MKTEKEKLKFKASCGHGMSTSDPKNLGLAYWQERYKDKPCNACRRAEEAMQNMIDEAEIFGNGDFGIGPGGGGDY